MKRPDRRETTLIASIMVLIILVAAGVSQKAGKSNLTNGKDWRQIELTDINSEENYTIAELDKPLLIETFAVWCPTCTNQQNEMKELHQNSNITSLSLNVDSNEDQQQVRRHTESNGFDWRYSISPPELTRKLVNEFGTTIANPPSAPVILVCENSSRRLQNGVKSSSKLKQEVDKGC